MVARPVVLFAAIIVAVAVVLPFVSSEDPSAGATFHVTFLNGDGTVLSEGDWEYRSIPYCVLDPIAPPDMRFVGWSTSPSAVSPEEIVPVEHDTEYHPVFMGADSVYGLTFDPSNGTDSPRTLYGAKGSTMTIPTIQVLGFSVKDDRGPFILNTWVSSDGTEYAVTQTVVLSSDIVLVADWIRLVAVTPEFDKDLPSSVSIGRFDELSLSVSCTETEGDRLTFEWFLRGESGDESLGTGSTMSLPDTLTSFPGIYTVYVVATNFDHQAVTQTASAISTECDVSVEGTYLLSILGTDIVLGYSAGESVDVPTVRKVGHTLADMLMPDGSSVPDGLVMPSHDLVLTPVWVADVCTLRFISDGSQILTMDVDYGDLVILIRPTDRGGLDFVGWDTGVDVLPHSTGIRVNGDLELVAVWDVSVPVCTVDGVRCEGQTVTLREEGVLYWYDSDGVRYLPGETVYVKDGQTFVSVPI